MPKYELEIKLQSLAFVPTWREKGEETKHTVLADSWIDIESLPASIQKRLHAIVKKAYLTHLKEKYG